MFNEDGVVNMDILLQNISNTNLIEYGMEMNEKLGKKRVDKMNTAFRETNPSSYHGRSEFPLIAVEVLSEYLGNQKSFKKSNF
uniref:Uncharacterized protein n=1 Tax=Meloidogyne enterolobii TaxID=390850 RepID=A0A6V7VT55_MELEN|nr:unnamed protein product [Meloidogyne enterolobii]